MKVHVPRIDYSEEGRFRRGLHVALQFQAPIQLKKVNPATRTKKIKVKHLLESTRYQKAIAVISVSRTNQELQLYIPV